MITLNDVIPLLPENYEVVGNKILFTFNMVSSLKEATEIHLTWIKPAIEDNSALLFQTKARAVLCGFSVALPNELTSTKCLLRVENPKLVLIKILNRWFAKTYEPGIHPTAIINSEATIHASAYIGPGCVIGNCKIGAYARLEANVTVYDGTIIGSNVIIQAGAVIGSDGFGHARSENYDLEHFPHIGNVVIQDDVHIGSNACIDRGVLGSTIISKGSKLNSFVFIAHNCLIGRNNLINPSVLVNGSVSIGDNNFIGTGSVIRNKVKIGSNTTIGMGAVVIKDVPDDDTVVGNPASTLKNKSNRPLH
jgi:UDP-3-O-[3-hydroxymyristoyl] glucosamine N-acyltransferase